MIPFTEIAGIQYGICESSDIIEMANLLAEAFSLFDPPAVAVGISAPEFVTCVHLFAPASVNDKLTIVARSTDTHEMVGALLTRDWVSPPPDGVDQLSKKFDPIFDILSQMDTDYQRGKVIQRGECLHLFFLGVARSCGGRGVAQQLVSACLENGRQKGYCLAVTEATNNVSQHVFRKLGFSDRVRRTYRDHRFEGMAPFASIEDHVGPILMDKPIS